MSFVIKFLSVIFTISLVAADPLPGGENVCNRTIPVRKDKTIQVPVQYTLKYQAMCHGGLIPCEKTRVETRMDTRLTPSIEDVIVSTCCPGYAETPDKRCAPICLDSCVNGKCVGPNVCKCKPEPTETSPGYVGPTCKRFMCLAVDRWGDKCDKTCDCSQNSYCEAGTGKCICRHGWRGANCNEECDSSMNCDDVVFPPILESEVNLIDRNARSQNLENLIPHALERGLADDVPKSNYDLLTAHMEFTVFLVALTIFLIFTVVIYRRRLNQLREELYGGQYSSSRGSNGSSGPYYDTGTHGQGGRQQIPLPNPHDNFLGKNLNFTAATRSILQDNDYTKAAVRNLEGPRGKTLFDSVVEKRLIAGQLDSKQNIYSEIDSNFTGCAYSIETSSQTDLPVDTSALDQGHYQVPRSSLSDGHSLHPPLSAIMESQDIERELQSSPLLSEDQTDNQLNIYEELRVPHKK